MYYFTHLNTHWLLMKAHTSPRYLIHILCILTLLWMASPAHALLGQNEAFLPADQAFALSHQEADGKVFLEWHIAPGYYLYSDRLKVSANGTPLTFTTQPSPTLKEDPYYGTVGVFYGFIRATMDAPSSSNLTVAYQGCAEAGLCYSPEKKTLTLTAPTPSNTTGLPANHAMPVNTGAFDKDSDLSLIQKLKSGNILTTLLVFFGAGLFTAFAGCSYPMFPILSNIILGEGTSITRARAFSLSLAYVLPIAIVYAVLGIIAGVFGSNLSALMQSPWAIFTFAGILVLMALSMFGLFKLHMPSAIQTRLNHLSNSQKGGTFVGAVVMGTLSAFIVSACTVPPIVAAISYIVQSGDVLLGAGAMFLFGLGLGVPLLLLGLSASWLLPKAGTWMTSVQHAMGFVLIGAAIYVASRVLSDDTTQFIWIVFGLIVGGVLIYTSPKQGAGLAVMSVGALSFVLAGMGMNQFANRHIQNSVQGDTLPKYEFTVIDGERDIQNVIHSNDKPTLIDFYADWCVSCKHMEKKVFSQVAVQSKFKLMNTLKLDITDTHDEEKALMKQYGVIGAPAILFLDKNGVERRELRVTGEMGSDAFIQRLNALLEQH